MARPGRSCVCISRWPRLFYLAGGTGRLKPPVAPGTPISVSETTVLFLFPLRLMRLTHMQRRCPFSGFCGIIGLL